MMNLADTEGKRACKYLETYSSKSNRRTKILCQRKIVFNKKGKTITHKDPSLTSSDVVLVIFEFQTSSDVVLVIFEFQKDDKRDIQVHMFHMDNKILNPVIVLATTV